jgi:hypothetical protein
MTWPGPEYEAKFFDLIEDDANGDARSVQTRIGPSGLGDDCIHCLACQIFQIPKQENPREIWNQTVGRALHNHMQGILEQANERAGGQLYLPERKVYVGDLGPDRITGTADAYDTREKIVVDWKFPGDKSIAWLRGGRLEDRIKETYRRQPHLYGLGYENEGYEVRGCMVLFIPITERTVRTAIAYKVPYDRQLALDTMARAQRLYDTVVRDGGPAKVIPRLKRKPYCLDCPRYPL